MDSAGCGVCAVMDRWSYINYKGVEKIMEPFKVYVLNRVSQREGHMVRAILTDETYKAIVDISNRTGEAISQICSKAIDYALANLEYVEY